MEAANPELVIFAGPTISKAEIASLIPAIVLGPVKRGDVYLATLLRPRLRAIAIVDGYFDQTPAVWHKEILWAISCGIKVYGSASMGALRAAELRIFGMQGVGRIFEQFRDGHATADDEVAVAHASEEERFRPCSDALVNIRGTLEAAEAAGIISAPTRRSLEAMARALFYPERSFRSVLTQARRDVLPRSELDALDHWLPTGCVDQKKLDALAMLREIKEQWGQPPRPPTFVFERTEAWLRLCASLERFPATDQSSPPSEGRRTSDPSWAAALVRAVALTEATERRTAITTGELDRVVIEFRRARGLESAQAFDDWANQAFSTEAALQRFFIEETFVRAVESRHQALAEQCLKNARISTGYARSSDT